MLIGGSSFLTTKKETRLHFISKPFGGRNAAAPTECHLN